MNWSAADVAEAPPEPSTITLTVPAPAGLVAVISVAETTSTLVARVVPNSTIEPSLKFVPVMITVVPPAAGPKSGLTPVTVGRCPVRSGMSELATGLPRPLARS